MHFPALGNIFAVASLISILNDAAPTSKCSSATRLAGARQIPYAYSLVGPGESAAAFELVPFADDCETFINPNGGPPIQVGFDAVSTRAFAVETRQIFSEVTGRYTDFKNGTTIIATNVTLGAVHLVPVPVTFSANVYLFYSLSSCLIERVQAFATIPTKVLGQVIDPPHLGRAAT